MGGAWFAVGSNVNNQKKKRGNSIVLNPYTHSAHDLVYVVDSVAAFPGLLKWKSLSPFASFVVYSLQFTCEPSGEIIAR